MKKHEAFPSKYLKTEDLNGKDATLTIDQVGRQAFKNDNGQEESKIIVCFKETNKLWVLNQANWDTIEALYGEDSEDWLDQKITVYPTKTRFGTKVVPCIRVRDKVAKSRLSKESENPADEFADEEVPF